MRARPNRGPIAGPLRQITGGALRPGQLGLPQGELADPSPPYEADGKLRIYGTGAYFLEYDSWQTLLEGGNATRGTVELFHPDGARIEGHQSAWDLLVHRWSDEGEVMYAGAMTPTGGRTGARWPEDNWNRRIYAFRKLGPDRWIRMSEPLFGSVPHEAAPSWLDHSYGHHFVESDAGETWIFYEKVTEQVRDSFGVQVPFRTEIFARKMITPFRAADEEVAILGVGLPPYPSTRRIHPQTSQPNGYLVEGPRPCRVQVDGESLYLLGFSCGDFATDHYTFNIAWSRSAAGPYVPLVETTQGKIDFVDFGLEFKRRFSLSWGPARPAFFVDPEGQLWVFFHAVDTKILERDYSRWPQEPLENFHRNIYLAPVTVRLDGENGLVVDVGNTEESVSFRAGPRAVANSIRG